MAIINKSAIVSYTPEQMYQLINDVEKYAEFVPYCTASRVNSKCEDEIHATLTFSGAGIQKSFTTVNRLQPHKLVEMRLVEGPFKQLEGFWSFEPMDTHLCRVSLNLEFELSAGILKMMFGPVFNQVAMMLVDSFQKRAKEVYG